MPCFHQRMAVFREHLVRERALLQEDGGATAGKLHPCYFLPGPEAKGLHVPRQFIALCKIRNVLSTTDHTAQDF